jgi:hypothetical protein
MRKDEAGKACPATLGEYRDWCAALREDSEAVAYFDRQIAKLGRGQAGDWESAQPMEPAPNVVLAQLIGPEPPR